MAAAAMEPWALGNPLPDFYDPCKNEVEERLYREALQCEYRRFGSGTLQDPCIVWFRPYDRGRGCRWVRQHHAVVAAVAKHYGMRFVWICAAAHDEEFLRTESGARIPAAWHADGSFKKFATRRTDYHVTFRLGDAPYRCRLAAHAYVAVDADQTPVGFLAGRDRLVPRAGAAPVDVWPWTGSAGFARTAPCYAPDLAYPSYYRPYSPASRYRAASFCGAHLPALCGPCRRARRGCRPAATGAWPTLETRLRVQLFEHAAAAYRARHQQLAAERAPLEADLAALWRMHRRLARLASDIAGEHHFGGQDHGQS